MIKRFVVSITVLSLLFLGIGAVFEQKVFSTKWKATAGKENETIKKTVRLFNKIFVDLYVSGGVPIRLNDFPASKQLRHELFRDIGYLRNKGFVLIYDMADLVFLKIERPSPRTAEVTTYEEWNYLYRKYKTRELAQSIKGMAAGFKYFLVKRKGRWLVVNYLPADVEHEKEKEFYY